MPAAFSLGIDFGTTNTVIAMAAADGPAHLVKFPAPEGELFAFRSCLSVHAPPEHPSERTIAAGPWAIDAYVEDPAETRFIQSFKSFAAAESFTETQILGRRYQFEDLLSAFLLKLLAADGVRFGKGAYRRPFVTKGAEVPDGGGRVSQLTARFIAYMDEDAAAVGWAGADHRRFLADFFAGRFPGSFARGADFQPDPGAGPATAVVLQGAGGGLLTVTFRSPIAPTAEARNAAFFFVDSISTTRASGRATASGMPGTPPPVPTSAIPTSPSGRKGNSVSASPTCCTSAAARSVMRVRFIRWFASRSRSR